MDYKRRNALKREHLKSLNHFLEDFKAKTRQYAKRQNIWYRKEHDFVWIDVMGGDGGSPKKLHTVVNRIVDCLKLDKETLKNEVLDSDA